MAFNYSPKIVTDGLVLYYDTANTKSYDRSENLALNSEALNLWANNGNAILRTPNVEIAPNGTLTADTLAQTAATGASRWVSSTTRTYTAGVTYTLSIWLKKVSGTDAQPSISLWVNGGMQTSVGTITNEWIRYSATFTPSSTISVNTFSGLGVSWGTNGQANNFVFAAWGFQIERGSSATTYIPTTSTPKLTGTTWIDLSRSGVNGTLINGPTFNSENGGSIVFDGVDDYADCGLSTFQPTQMTLSVWVSRGSLADGGIITRGNINALTELGISFGYTPSFGPGGGYPPGYYIVGRVTTAGNQLLYPYPTSSLNTFHNITYTVINNTSAALYYDGNIVASTNTVGSIGVDGTNMILGKWNNYGPLNGKISNAQIYNRALSATEVLQNFNATKTRFGL